MLGERAGKGSVRGDTRRDCSAGVRADPPAAASRASAAAQQVAVGRGERGVRGRGMDADADAGATLGRPRWPCAGRALAALDSAARGPAGADAAVPLCSARLRAAQARAPPPRRSLPARGTLATPRGGAAELGAWLAPACARSKGPGTPAGTKTPTIATPARHLLPPEPRRVGARVAGGGGWGDVRKRIKVKVVS